MFNYFNQTDNLNLTLKEQEILVRVAHGEHNAHIADCMNVSINTIKARLQNIFLKLNVQDRTSAVVKAIKYKLIDIY